MVRLKLYSGVVQKKSKNIFKCSDMTVAGEKVENAEERLGHSDKVLAVANLEDLYTLLVFHSR